MVLPVKCGLSLCGQRVCRAYGTQFNYCILLMHACTLCRVVGRGHLAVVLLLLMCWFDDCHTTIITLLLCGQLDGQWIKRTASANNDEMGGDHGSPSAGALRYDGDWHGIDQPAGWSSYSWSVALTASWLTF